MAEESAPVVASTEAKMQVETPAVAAETTSVILPEDEELAKKCLAQVEFYFNDSNLPYDKFLWTATQRDPLHQGWVDIATVASFSRMKEYLAKGLPWVVEALRRSEELLAVDQDGKKVRRTRELKPPTDAFARSVYAKGFPAESPSLQLELEEWFNQFGKVNVVRMRKGDDKVFKNSVFTEFAEMESVEKFLALEPKPTFQGAEISAMTKDAYVQMKMKEKNIDPNSIQRGSSASSTMPKGKFNAFKLMDTGSGGSKRKREDNKEQREEEERKRAKKIEDLEIEYLGQKLKVNSEGNLAEPSALVPPTGHVLSFSGAGPDGDWRVLKADLVTAGFTSPFISFPKGTTGGAFENSAEAFTPESLAALQARDIVVGGQKIQWSFLEGDDLRAHYVSRANFQGKKALEAVTQAGTSSSSRSGGSGRGGRGGARGGRGGGRGGKGGNRPGDRNSERAEKVAGEKKDESGSSKPRTIDNDSVAGQGTRGQTSAPVLAMSTDA
ncbi:FOG: RRM domain [Phaffia rhodozyma]|uniref:FOG: RRM domain n=1 Tax=Phaffia rhodozyma TaxID=264483 RepID=A0A0F7SUX4_PHARH|nr:FOG: RRM domain [Phaffia rhodozyma]